MSTAVPYNTIHRLAIPATLAGLAEPVLSITDTAIVGNIPVDGLESLAAVGIVGSFLSMLIWVLGQTRSAISAIISQYLGAGRLAEVRNLPAQAIFFNICLSLLILFSTVFVVKEIFTLFNASGKILAYCISYYGIRVWGFPLTLFTFAVMGIFRGLQDTFHPMLIALIGALANIGLDFAFVYGIPGLIPPMHLEGAAWASLLSQGIMAGIAAALLIRKTEISLIPNFPLHPELGRLALMSLNLFVRAVALNVALVLAVREATALGPRYIGAHTIAINLWLFAAFFIDGYAAAGNSIGGRLLGAKDYRGLWTLARKVVACGGSVSLVLMGLGYLLYMPLGRLFSQDPGVLQAFGAIFFIVILGLPMNSVAFLFDGIFKGLGEMKYLRNVLLSATFLGFVPLLYLGKYLGWGLYGIWIAFTMWMCIRGAALVWKFRHKFLPLMQKA